MRRDPDLGQRLKLISSANYARDQEVDNEPRTTRFQLKKKNQDKPVTQRDAVTSDDSATESEDLNTTTLVKELIKLRREIRRCDELHEEELQKVNEEFSVALAEVRHELQTLRDRPPTPQSHAEACAQNSHNDILARFNPYAMPSALPFPLAPRPMQMSPVLPHSVTRATFGRSQHTSTMARNENERMSAGPIRAVVETEIRTIECHTHWRCRAVTVDPKNTNRIRIACRGEDEHQLIKKVAEARIGPGARAAVLDEKDGIRAEAAAVFSEENEATVAKVACFSRKDNAKPYGSMVVYLTKGTDARRLLDDGFLGENLA
ncbi:hypothetical protein MYU51_018695 [Penicillium brevicompactum]